MKHREAIEILEEHKRDAVKDGNEKAVVAFTVAICSLKEELRKASEREQREEMAAARRRFLQALYKFDEAAKAMTAEWFALHPLDQDWADAGYPFAESFDEMASRITEWRCKLNQTIADQAGKQI